MSNAAHCWMIKRNCSVSPKQLALVFASIVAVSCVFGVVFAAQGLWLVLPFVGVQLLAVAAAFLCYGRRAADYERIEIADGVIAVELVEGSRRSLRHLPVAWTRVEVGSAGGAGSVSLARAARGERVPLGRHLPDVRRARLGEELKVALREAVPA
jgi:uncharacterized membrane protein